MAVYYVPAGMESYLNTNTTLYAVDDKSPRASTFTRFDKLWTTGQHKLRYSKQPFNHPLRFQDGYDRCTSFTGPAYFKDNGIKMVLINPASKPHGYNSLKDAGIITICDSGGFQLLKGTQSFIDPVEVGKSYNRLANIGMDLDIPASWCKMEKADFKALALIQKANYERMKEVVKPSVKLCLVNHGYDVEARQRNFEYLDRPASDVEYLSVAGFAVDIRSPIRYELRFVEAILNAIATYPKVKYLHCLGATSFNCFAVYCLIEHLGLVKNIGGDSVSYLMDQASGRYTLNYPFLRYVFPKNTHVFTRLNCQCNVCTLVQDATLINSYLSNSHNLLAYKGHIEYLYDLTGHMIKGDISIADYLKISTLNIPLPDYQKLYDYVMEFAATRKFKPLAGVRTNSLFERKVNKNVYAHYEKVIEAYEAYYQKRFR